MFHMEIYGNILWKYLQKEVSQHDLFQNLPAFGAAKMFLCEAVRFCSAPHNFWWIV